MEEGWLLPCLRLAVLLCGFYYHHTGNTPEATYMMVLFLIMMPKKS